MNSVEHIVSLVSAPWCGWTLLVLLVCAVLGEYMQPGIITQAYTTLTARTDRTYKEAPVNLQGQILVGLFRIGTIALAVSLCIATGNTFTFGMFAIVSGWVIAMLLVKLLVNTILDYTFMLSHYFPQAYSQHRDIATLTSCILYPGLLLALRIDDLTVNWWIFGVIAGLFILMFAYRLALHFIQSLTALLYVVVYICTVEILPIGALLYLSSITIASI